MMDALLLLRFGQLGGLLCDVKQLFVGFTDSHDGLHTPTAAGIRHQQRSSKTI